MRVRCSHWKLLGQVAARCSYQWQQHCHSAVCCGCPPSPKATEKSEETQKNVTGMSQVSWKILPWHRRLNKLKPLRPGYKSELGNFSKRSTVLQLQDGKQGVVQIPILPWDDGTFLLKLEYAHWSHKNVTPGEVSPPRAATVSHWVLLDPCPCQRHISTEPALRANAARLLGKPGAGSCQLLPALAMGISCFSVSRTAEPQPHSKAVPALDPLPAPLPAHGA